MDLLFIFTSSLFFLWVAREILSWLTLWQQNDYRPDRFFVSFKQKRNKKRSFFWLLLAYKWLLFFAYASVIFNDNYLTTYRYGVFVLFSIQALVVFKEIYTNTLKKPRLTFRGVITILLSLGIILAIFMNPLMEVYFWLLLIDILTPIIVSIFIFMLIFPTELLEDWQIDKAVKKIEEHNSLLVIGITGGHGKSAAKDFIAQILSKKFRVIKTQGKNNTTIGIAKTILKDLQSDTQILVAEMSAYKRGEIAQLCDFIHPRIGVLTAITNQHVSLFKTFDAIMKTNYELVESLPKDGFCLFNGTSLNTYTLFKKSRRQKRLYYFGQNKARMKKDIQGRADIAGFIDKKTRLNNLFTVDLNGNIFHFHLSPHVHLDYILPAIYIAHHLGMNEREIQRALGSLAEK